MHEKSRLTYESSLSIEQATANASSFLGFLGLVWFIHGDADNASRDVVFAQLPGKYLPTVAEPSINFMARGFFTRDGHRPTASTDFAWIPAGASDDFTPDAVLSDIFGPSAT